MPTCSSRDLELQYFLALFRVSHFGIIKTVQAMSLEGTSGYLIRK